MQELQRPLQVTQTAALLEVVHAGIGLVRSPVMTTLQQVASRIFIVWGILYAAPVETMQSVSVFRCEGLGSRVEVECEVVDQGPGWRVLESASTPQSHCPNP